MSRIALVLMSILLSSAADAQVGNNGAASFPSAPGFIGSGNYSDGTSTPSTDWRGADAASLPFYSADPSGLSASLTASSPSFLNQVPVSRIGYVDLLNIPSDTPGYNLNFKGRLGAQVAIGPEIWNWPDVKIGEPRDLLRFDETFDYKIVGPEGAGGAIVGIFGNINAIQDTLPPAVEFLQTDTTQDAFSSACQAAVDALLPFRGQYYEPCQSVTSTDFGQCRGALQTYVRSCLAFAKTVPGEVRPPEAPPEVSPDILSRITAVSGILFHVADNPANNRIYCTAVRISRSWLLTARHCGFRRDRGNWVPLNTSEIRFVPFDSPTLRLKVSTPVDPKQLRDPLTYFENDTSNDYMFFRIDGEEPDDPQPLEPLRAGDKLVLFSFAVTALMDADPGQAVSDELLVRDGTWTRFMAYDSSRTCLVGATPPPNCLAYACQAVL
jgi:hypothetical protein